MDYPPYELYERGDVSAGWSVAFDAPCRTGPDHTGFGSLESGEEVPIIRTSNGAEHAQGP